MFEINETCNFLAIAEKRGREIETPLKNDYWVFWVCFWLRENVGKRKGVCFDVMMSSEQFTHQNQGPPFRNFGVI